ncbi:hypothetical protein FIE12Z_10790 [Fusarium flagelliforme]|uniref:Copper-fist domain-containing protein n=1 Tax=Fusarium flagelliforme TaxID=2675880 RepID=A0A395MAX5_9HYPO|nr:hypothetical protein FIE12Z_10790 [Fusarium flagelliforme]
MPLINGIKMACEPCIRGHRSTKCTHANERLMVPVRKPGRPLSSCPHPASRPCSCGRVTAAIPKKQACHCGPSKDAESPILKPENGDSASSSTPQSPVSKTPGSGYRVQKTSSKGSNSSRRESVDPAALQRMDPKMLNILPSFEDTAQKSATPLADMNPYGSMGMTPADSPFGPVMYPMFQHVQPPILSPDISKRTMANQSGSMTSTHVLEESNPPAPKVGSCCGGGSSSNAASTPITLAAAPSPPKPKKSCCSSNNDSPKADHKTDTMSVNDLPTPNSMMMSPFPAPIMMPNGMYAYYPQPTVFTYPPQYGSYLQPLQPEQWRQVMATMTFAGQGGMPSPYGMPGATPFQNPTAPQTPHSASGTSHQCSCGASSWQSMMDTGYTHVNGHGNGEVPATNGHNMNGSTPAVPPVGSAEGTVSPVAPQTPSEAASGISEEQALSANDFFFVSYPFGDSCAGEEASCPCGDDCQCLGCVIHGNNEAVVETESQA